MSKENKVFITEDERLAYELGYEACCLDHGIPFVKIRHGWKDMVRNEVMLSNVTFEKIPIEVIAQDIAKEMRAEYDKYKRQNK